VRFITLAAGGAGTDAVARTLADALSRRWAQPVVIDNRPGGDGIVSIETFLAGARGQPHAAVQPDCAWTALPLMHEQLTFNPVRDLIPLYFVVQGLHRARRLTATRRPYAGDLVARHGPSPEAHLGVRAQRTFPGLHRLPERCRPRPYLRPLPQPIAALPDLAEGRVDLAFLPLAPLIGPAQAGKLRLVAVASDDRAPLAPDVPTARQAGFPTMSLFEWPRPVSRRKEMPEPLRARIADDCARS